MKLDRVKELLLDLALTIQVHPIALGIKAEATGQIFIPQQCRIEATQATNVFDYNNRDKELGREHTRVKKLSAGLHTIPERVLSLKVKTGILGHEGRVDAVMVVEHRSLAEFQLQESLIVGNVIVVMTAGFPDSSTKEFLHLLSIDARIRYVPFLYFGDHDIPGYSIFQCLKYGSRASAWVSAISVCPQLKYAGPTLADLKESSTLFRPRWEAQYRLKHPDATDSKVKEDTDAWQANVDQKINGKLTNLTRKDREMVRSFEKLGWVQHEKVIQEEIAAMEQGKGVFRFANLAQISPQYVRQFIEAKVRPTRVAIAIAIESSSVGHPETATSQGDVESIKQTDVAEPLELDVDLEEAMMAMF